MSKAIVFNNLLSKPNRERVSNLLERERYEPVFDPTPVSAIDLSSDIGVVCLPIDELEVGIVNQRIAEFTRAGARVMAIWLDEDIREGLPLGIEGLGSAAVSINSPRMAKALAGEAIWETPRGVLRAKKPLKRNC